MSISRRVKGKYHDSVNGVQNKILKKENMMKTLIAFICIIACTPLLVSNVSAASAKCTIVKIEAVYAPRAIKPGWEQENSPMYPLMTFRLSVMMIEINVSFTTSRR